MADNIPMIDVPAVEAEAYNPDRPISGLIQMQLVHLSNAERRLPEKKRTGINIAMLHTEGEAAGYIQKVTAMLHPKGSGKKTAGKKRALKKKTGKSHPSSKKPAAKRGKRRKTAKARK